MRPLVVSLWLAIACSPAAPPPGLAAGTNGLSAAPVELDPAVYHARANDALQTLLVRYWAPSSSYLAKSAPATGALTGYWTFAQAFDAVLDGVERTKGARFRGWIETLYQAQNARGWSRDFYDDESWMVLVHLRAHDLTREAKYLDRAKTLYADIKAAWDTSCCGANPGGIWWDRPRTQKATAANAGPVIAGVRLAARTGDGSHLAFATQVYAYWRTHMVDPSSFAVFDHIEPSGNIVKWKFTYNEGLMIGAALELHGATGGAAYLADAHRLAARMLAAETKPTALGKVLFDGTGCSGDCQQFKGIGYRYLSALYDIDNSRDEYRAVLQASADAIWTLARAPSGLYATDWAGPAPTAAAAIEAQSSAAMALNLFAAGLGPDLPARAGHYEAEDAVVHGLGLETAHAGFDGWAYLAGWKNDGQRVDFHVEVATAGSHSLTLRYAAGAGVATRLLSINGAAAVAKLAFAATASWAEYATQTVTVTLPAGASTISLIFDSSKGSANHLNLDALDLVP